MRRPYIWVYVCVKTTLFSEEGEEGKNEYKISKKKCGQLGDIRFHKYIYIYIYNVISVYIYIYIYIYVCVCVCVCVSSCLHAHIYFSVSIYLCMGFFTNPFFLPLNIGKKPSLFFPHQTSRDRHFALHLHTMFFFSNCFDIYGVVVRFVVVGGWWRWSKF